MVAEWLQAAERGDVEAVKKFLESGIDINIGNSINITALMQAVGGGHVELIRLLLDRGASLSPRTSFGHTALTIALVRSGIYRHCREVPHQDSRPLDLLIAAGARYELREAVMMNDVSLARALLDEGADPDSGEGLYEGPILMIAAGLGYLELVDLLLDRGANIEATDDLNQTALKLAEECGQLAVVGRLIDGGAKRHKRP
jgi:ankyrin repeat protein